MQPLQATASPGTPRRGSLMLQAPQPTTLVASAQGAGGGAATAGLGLAAAAVGRGPARRLLICQGGGDCGGEGMGMGVVMGACCDAMVGYKGVLGWERGERGGGGGGHRPRGGPIGDAGRTGGGRPGLPLTRSWVPGGLLAAGSPASLGAGIS
jgi:hypothetical protein